MKLYYASPVTLRPTIRSRLLQIVRANTTLGWLRLVREQFEGTIDKAYTHEVSSREV